MMLSNSSRRPAQLDALARGTSKRSQMPVILLTACVSFPRYPESALEGALWPLPDGN